MNKSQKLFESIGRLDDRDLAAALDYKAESPAKPRARFSVIMAAVIAAVGLMLMAFTYGDEILSAIFKRQTELIDDKIGHIDEFVTVGNITLTMDSVTVDEVISSDVRSFYGTYTVSFHNEDGNFDRGLKYSGYKLQSLFDASWDGDDVELRADGSKWITMHRADAFSFALSDFNEGLDKGLVEPSDTVTLTSHLCVGRYDDCRIIFYDLTSADGSIKYADEISVEFTVTEDVAKPLKQLSRYDPNIKFTIEDTIFMVREITVDVDKMYVVVYNPYGNTVNIGGVDCCAINYFTKLSNGEKFFEINKRYSDQYNEVRQYVGNIDNDEERKAYDEWMMSDERLETLTEMVEASTPTDDENILNECYELLVELNPECGAEITSISSHNCGYTLPATPDSIIATMSAEFSSPIYLDDIVRVYARKIGDPSVEVTIWVPAEDYNLKFAAK